jgi:hypothetical protein
MARILSVLMSGQLALGKNKIKRIKWDVDDLEKMKINAGLFGYGQNG